MLEPPSGQRRKKDQHGGTNRLYTYGTDPQAPYAHFELRLTHDAVLHSISENWLPGDFLLSIVFERSSTPSGASCAEAFKAAFKRL